MALICQVLDIEILLHCSKVLSNPLVIATCKCNHWDMLLKATVLQQFSFLGRPQSNLRGFWNLSSAVIPSQDYFWGHNCYVKSIFEVIMGWFKSGKLKKWDFHVVLEKDELRSSLLSVHSSSFPNLLQAAAISRDSWRMKSNINHGGLWRLRSSAKC